MTSKWSDETLTAARLEGDPEADAIVERILTAPKDSGVLSRGGYNHVLDLATMLESYPELALVESSLLRTQLDAASQVSGFFDPAPAPDWIDEQKLARAGELWQTDAILAISVLYAASLPACYLMKKGVPALYRTEKLAEQKYVFQRIYETGLMLEGVMSPGGIKIIKDLQPSADAVMASALNSVDPGGQWSWEGQRLRRGGGAFAPLLSPDAVRQAITATERQAKRYIWGPGFIAARKVRFLHSSMRYMLMHPEMMRPAAAPPAPDAGAPHSFMDQASRRTQSWDVAELGKPINQEDLAFVLLTFGYLIPKGMGAWGREVPREQKEAFLHLWRVVGYVMGIREDLMTDNLDEAAALYEQILKRNGEGSEAGKILAEAVMNFVSSYLPARLGVNQYVPPALIIDQLGADWAKQVLPEARYRAARRPFARLTHGVAKLGVRGYYWLRRRLLALLPIVGPVVTDLTTRSTDILIDSWRDSFRRKPFYVPANVNTWVPDRNVTPEYEASLQRWRQKLFDTLAGALVAIVVAGFALIATVIFFVLDFHTQRNIAALATAGCFLIGVTLMNVTVPAIAKQRPKLQDQ